MLVSYNWLKDYIDIDFSKEELIERLNMSGAPVEEIIDIKFEASGIVAAKILKIEPHPNADKLSYCDVTDGKDTFKIVCGASNIKEGLTVPLARIGAVLPGNFRIKKTKLRGLESQGMMCSAKELGLGSEHSGIMILDDSVYKPGMKFDPVTPDTVLNLEITPNRPDLLCITGVARLIAALTRKKTKMPSFELNDDLIEKGLDIKKELSIEIQNPEKCPRYTARLVRGITVKESPGWLKNRLLAIGIRPINNVVDVTNYVLFELNQPLHAFDLKKIKDSRINVRTAQPGEKILALDEKEYSLTSEDLLICDSKDPIAIGGVMGGENFSVSPETSDVVLESACFNPSSIRRTSKILGIHSDSSYRFERGADITGAADALNRAASLLIETAGGKASENIIDLYPGKSSPKKILLRFKRANSVLGSDLDSKTILEIISALGFEYSDNTQDTVSVAIPGYRVDLKDEIDLIEDIAQIYGYNELPSTLPSGAATCGGKTGIDDFTGKLMHIMLSFGFTEVVNYSFLNNKFLRSINAQTYAPSHAAPVKNPFNDEETLMKTSLIPGLIKNLITNHNNENKNIHLFEAANIFSMPSKGNYIQKPMLGAVSCGNIIEPAFNKKSFSSDLYYIKSAISSLHSALNTEKELEYEETEPNEFFEYSFDIKCGEKRLGSGGRLKEEILYENKIKEKAFLFELSIQELFELYNPASAYRPISRFPSVKRDISLVVDRGIPEIKIENIIKKGNSSVIKSLKLFDLYKGSQIPEDKKSLSFSIEFQSEKKTLAEAEINRIMDKITAGLKSDISAELRS
ncbi:MAG: phenylalanine--tRNA ligase subunit beta [Candidatus Goldiibacteriota bacterium]